MTPAIPYTLEDDFADMVAAVELTLSRTFENATLLDLFQAVQARIDELIVPAAQEVEFDANSLELGILRELLSNMASMSGVQATSLQVH